MDCGILAGDQAGELEQYSGQSRSGDRYGSCRGVGHGGRDRHPVHLRWLPRCTCPGGPADKLPRHTCPASPDRCRYLLEGSCGRPGQSDRLHICRGQAVSRLHSAQCARVVTGPTLALALALEIVLGFAFTVALEIVLGFALTVALEIALVLGFAFVIPVADGLGRRA